MTAMRTEDSSETRLREFQNELRWNDVAYKLGC